MSLHPPTFLRLPAGAYVVVAALLLAPGYALPYALRLVYVAPTTARPVSAPPSADSREQLSYAPVKRRYFVLGSSDAASVLRRRTAEQHQHNQRSSQHDGMRRSDCPGVQLCAAGNREYDNVISPGVGDRGWEVRP